MDRIQLKIVKEVVFPLDVTQRVDEDIYLLNTPLCHGYVALESDGHMLHDGAVRPGMIRISSPGETVRRRVQTPNRAISLRFPGSRMRETLLVEGHRPGMNVFIEPLLHASSTVAALSRSLAFAQERHNEQLLIDGVAHALLACILHQRGGRSRGRTRSSPGFSPAEQRRATDYAEAHLSNGIDLDTWARQVDMTAVEFTNRFQSSLNDSPYSWYQKLRIARAKELICTTSLSLAQVALEVGFCSQSHFTFVFRKIVGFPPRHWKQVQSSARSKLSDL